MLAVIDAPREAQGSGRGGLAGGGREGADAQAEARIKTMEGERDAAAAAVKQAESDIDRLVAARELAQKQLARVQGPGCGTRRGCAAASKSTFSSSIPPPPRERTARLAVATAKAQLAAAVAKVEQSRADLAEAKAAVSVAEARLAKARVNVEYTEIIAPFDGVVTDRAFHPGAFIRSASEGGQASLLTVKRTDLMRVIVQVPDRDVVITSVGDPAELRRRCPRQARFSRGRLPRMGESEDPTTRTMRVEIDLAESQGAPAGRHVRHGDDRPRAGLAQPDRAAGLRHGTLRPNPRRRLCRPRRPRASHSGRARGRQRLARRDSFGNQAERFRRPALGRSPGRRPGRRRKRPPGYRATTARPRRTDAARPP